MEQKNNIINEKILYEERLELKYYYVKNIILSLEVKYIFDTTKTIITKMKQNKVKKICNYVCLFVNTT